MRTKLLLLSFVPILCFAKQVDVSIENLRTELLTNPVGLDCPTPMFSWEIYSDANGVEQKSYRILVASSPALLNANMPDMWDSKTVKSDKSNYIEYGGKPLESGHKYAWKVIVGTNEGKATSMNATWTTALMSDDEWQAAWIGGTFPSDVNEDNHKARARYLRKEFKVNERITKAILYICGLGLYEAYINGEKVGKAELAPTPTDYNHSVRYNTYDVTNLVHGDLNAIGVVLGNGRYVGMRSGILHFGTPQLIAQLEITTTSGAKQVIYTDKTWKITDNGPIGYNSEFDGEDYDANKEMAGWTNAKFDDSEWLKATIVDAPKGKLTAQINPNITVMDNVHPVEITERGDSTYILDMGQNMVGWLNIKLNGNEGDTLRMRFAETLQADGTIYTANLRSAAATDTYISNGQPSTWRPSFTYHGFRYVEMSGFSTAPSLDDITGEVLYDEMSVTGTFNTSNDVLNRIYNNAYWGIRGNYRGMPTDCPQRDERMGWLGDRAVGSQGECYIFDNHLLYAKWMQDIEETQRPDSVISDVAPRYWSIDNEDVTWPAAWFTITNMLYDQYGDVRPIKKHYEAMKKYMLLIKSKHMTDYIVTHDTYGDWCMPPEEPQLIHSQDPARKTDGALLSTSFYNQLALYMAKFATINGNDEDAAMWTELADNVRKAFLSKFYDNEKGYFGNNTVTANILPLRFGFVDDNAEVKARLFENIIEKTTNEYNGHVSTGLIGIQQLMRGLTDGGRGDLALKIATNVTYPSWGYMLENGATTIWELWNGDTADPAMNSGNHVMLLGDLIVWCYNYLAGIGQTPSSVAFKEIRLKPYPVPGLSSAAASYNSLYGTITSSWEKINGKFKWDFYIPCNTTAEVYIPTDTKKIEGGKYLRKEDGYSVFLFKAGSYSIETAE